MPELLQPRPVWPVARDDIADVGCTLQDGGERVYHRVEPFVVLDAGDRDEPPPGPVRDGRPLAQCGRVHAGPEVIGIGAQVHDAESLALSVEPELAQHRERGSRVHALFAMSTAAPPKITRAVRRLNLDCRILCCSLSRSPPWK